MASYLRRAAARASELVTNLMGGNSASDDEGSEERRGFAVKREVAVEAPRAPLIQYAVSMFGGAATGAVQSLEWFAAMLREDDEGDVADEFLEETVGTSVGGQQQNRRGALHTLLVTTKPRLAAWVRVVGGWPFSGEAAVG